MAIREIVKYPDPRLNEACTKVDTFDDALGILIDDMFETMYEAEGVGLAAPQIGILKRITVIDVSETRDERLEFVNPEIVARDGKIPSEEGCLSIPGYRDTVKRNDTVTVRAQDRHGEHFEIEADELLCIALQHEIDHLDGVLFIDKMSKLKLKFFKRWYQKNEPL